MSHRVGKLNKSATQLNWVLLMEQMKSFAERFSKEQVKEDPVCCKSGNIHMYVYTYIVHVVVCFVVM